MENFRISLAAARVNAGMTQDEVSKAIGCSKATLIGWEKGKHEIRGNQLVKLCQLYGISLNHIFLPIASEKLGLPAKKV